MLASRLVKSCLVLIVSLSPIAAKASFVVDGFTSVSQSSTAVGDSGKSLRTISFSDTPAPILSLAGGLRVDWGQLVPTPSPDFSIAAVNINYSPNGFANFGASSGNPALDRIRLTFSNLVGTVRVSVNGGVFTTLTGSEFNFVVPGMASANGLTLTLARSGLGSSAVTLGELTATPEPTTMLMFGSVAGAGFLARRRWKNRSV